MGAGAGAGGSGAVGLDGGDVCGNTEGGDFRALSKEAFEEGFGEAFAGGGEFCGLNPGTIGEGCRRDSGLGGRGGGVPADGSIFLTSLLKRVFTRTGWGGGGVEGGLLAICILYTIVIDR